MKNLTILPLILLSLTVSSCAVTTAGVKKGDERNFVRSIHDVNAERAIKSRMTRAYDFKLKGVNPEVREGIVVLTGNVPTQKDRIEAERIAWSAQRIDQVGNEILVKDKQSHTRKVKDGLLETSVNTRLTADKYVKARNINVEAHDGISTYWAWLETKQNLNALLKLPVKPKEHVKSFHMLQWQASIPKSIKSPKDLSKDLLHQSL